MSQHDTRLGRHSSLLRAIGLPVMATAVSHIRCPACGQEIRYDSDRTYGYSTQTCGCGSARMERHTDAPLLIDPRLVADVAPDPRYQRAGKTPKRKETRRCVRCQAKFIAVASGPRDTCSSVCWYYHYGKARKATRRRG
jgi:hypothetical protein